VAVREVEAWLLADGTNFSRFLRVQEGALPKDVEAIKDPKACLIGLARKSRSREIASVSRHGPAARQSRAVTTTLAW